MRPWVATVALLVVVAAGLAVVADAHPFVGLLVIGLSLVGAGLLRAALPERRLGLLVVRGRVPDAAFLAGVGLALIVIAASLRDSIGG